MLDEIIKEYKEEASSEKRDWRTYEERLTKRLHKAFKELKPLVHEAVSSISIVKGENKGANSLLTLEQKVLVLLLKHLFGKSNRNMAAMMAVFTWLTDISVCYKTVERLYSDEQVILALHNLHVLILKQKDLKEAECTGDGTGYALTVKKHYATEAQKLKDKMKENSEKRKNNGKKSKRAEFIYSFALMDVDTRMHIGCGTSFKSEKEAFLNAMDMAKETDVNVNSLRLDRYYSAQSYVKLCQGYLGKMKLYMIPKTNATINGCWQWKRMLYEFVNGTKEYLKEYYKRNQSESGFAEDKRRTGWKLKQKRPDRVDTANFCTSLWHNLHWLG